MATEPMKAIELQGVMSALHVLRVLTPELQPIASALDQKIAQMPSLFADAPVVIDLRALEPDDSAQRVGIRSLRLGPLVDLLKTRGLVPVAVRGGAKGRLEEARAAGLGVLEWDRSGPAKKPPRENAGAAAANPTPTPSQPSPPPRSAGTIDASEARPQTSEHQGALMLQQPLRAGQIVYAEGCDAIAMAAVNTGAELIADGNVHVYGVLRGRALAGVYVSADDIPADRRGKPVQIYLREGNLVIQEL